MTHCEMVLEYMKKHGCITQNDAFYDLGCTRLSGRIYDLKKRGLKINRTIEHGTNRFGEPCCYAKYTLVEG